MLPSSKYYGTLTHQKGQFEHQEKQRADEAKKSGQILSGYKNFDLSTGKKGGGRQTETMQQAMYIDAPKAAPSASPASASVPEPAPEPASEAPAPVQYSPKMQEAKERVSSYKDNILSGETTDEIFTSSKPQQATQSFLDKESFQFNQAGYNK